jgi:hypothetical protein
LGDDWRPNRRLVNVRAGKMRGNSPIRAGMSMGGGEPWLVKALDISLRSLCRAFRQAEKVVWFLTVSFGLEVFVTEPTRSDDNPNRLTSLIDIKTPFAAFD